MKNLLIIFGAKYLIILAVGIFIWYLLIQPREIKKQILIFGVLVLPLAYIAAKISSYFYYDPRPFVAGNFVPLISHVPDNGFPSDHTLFSAALAAIAIYFNRKVGTLLFAIAAIIGAARVLAGVHHAVDVVGSLVIVGVVSWLTHEYLLPLALRSKIFFKSA